TVVLLRRQGVAFDLLLCTAGDRGSNEPKWTRESLAATRAQEARAAADLLGVERVGYLGYPDGELEPTLTLRAEIARYYREWQPDTVFTFDPGGFLLNHPDHRAAGRTALDALIPSSMALYHAEQLTGGVARAAVKRVFLWTAATPTVFVEVTPVYEEKFAACLAHASQFPEPNRLDWMKGLDGERGKRINVEYAESFGSAATY
ncbi:MAG TPA: PIG-L deacetylase family protein, partial [Chloroflexia bacterium]|nr:PIG-L deacetylase family protein [Chloroflexia bacterium]